MNNINKIFIINLEKCNDRKRHMEDEMNIHKINNYEFIKANTINDDIVLKNIYNIKDLNGKNLFITKLANWYSIINLMKKIINEDIKGLICILEDDVKFIPKFSDIINNLINKNFLNNMSNEEPIYIKLTNGFESPKLANIYNKKIDVNISNHNLIICNNEKEISNPGCIINKKYAEYFINSINKIKNHGPSDIFLINNIFNKIKTYKIFPWILYELSSCGKLSKFKSVIRNKN